MNDDSNKGVVIWYASSLNKCSQCSQFPL